MRQLNRLADPGHRVAVTGRQLGQQQASVQEQPLQVGVGPRHDLDDERVRPHETVQPRPERPRRAVVQRQEPSDCGREIALDLCLSGSVPRQPGRRRPPRGRDSTPAAPQVVPPVYPTFGSVGVANESSKDGLNASASPWRHMNTSDTGSMRIMAESQAGKASRKRSRLFERELHPLGTRELTLAVSGYKSVGERCAVTVKPLTVLSGANSAGKSAFMQPFLLMKQTMEASFDPGALLLHGPNAKLTEAGQLLTHGKNRAKSQRTEFSVEVSVPNMSRRIDFSLGNDSRLEIATDSFIRDGHEVIQRVGKAHLSSADIEAITFSFMRNSVKPLMGDGEVSSSRERCFLTPSLQGEISMSGFTFLSLWERLLQDIIHLPGLRGDPLRQYPSAAIGSTFPGMFQDYVASIVDSWHAGSDPRLAEVSSDLAHLGLTWKVRPKRVSDAFIELEVGRMPNAQQGGAGDLVNLADVGLGLSQILPVLVALRAGRPGQIVYLEQPEIHLHPRAQWKLADLLISVAETRGIRVIVETHSSLLIRGIQTAVAAGKIRQQKVSLNWFTRDPSSGFTQVTPVKMARDGSVGDWPADFDQVEQEADIEYLSAAMKR